MMNIPSVPTDNIYKFIAISGLVAWLTIQVVSTIWRHDQRNAISSLGNYSATSLSEVLRCRTDSLRICAAIRMTMQGYADSVVFDGLSISLITSKEIPPSVQISYDSLKTQFHRVCGETIIADAHLTDVRDQIHDIKSDINLFMFYHFFGTLISFYFILTGFWMWQKRVQVFEDIILRGKAAAYMTEEEQAKYLPKNFKILVDP